MMRAPASNANRANGAHEDPRDATVDLSIELIRRQSITPADEGCQSIIARRLESCGFRAESFQFGKVSNLWARKGSKAPVLAFLGHTDVVPTGPTERWTSPPFEPAIRDGRLYGRGAADMKGSVAAFTTACERFCAGDRFQRGSVAMLLTSDEEGPAVDGTVRVVESLRERSETIDWCLVGEPSSRERVGDVIKNGRRGSLSGHLVVEGRQGHVAYPHLARNPIHDFARILARLDEVVWDVGNAHFPPTTFQVSNVSAGTGATNVIPGTLDAQLNFRYSTEISRRELEERVTAILDECGLRYRLDWSSAGGPFLTPAGELVEAVRIAVHEVVGIEPLLSTEGGTSDGRFVAPTGAQVVELGPVNATIHSIDEHVAIADLAALSAIYEGVLEHLLGPGS